MKITNSTGIAPIPMAENIGQLKNLLSKQCNLDTADVNAIIEIGSGVGVAAAMQNAGTYNKKGSDQSNQGNFRSRLATAMLNIARIAMAPISEKIAEENKLARQAEIAQDKQDKIDAWIKGGRVGRRPNGFVDPSESAVKDAYHEAVSESREQHGLGNMGRIIPISLSRAYHESLKKIFAAKLKVINKTTKLTDTIDNLVDEFVVELDEKTLVVDEIKLALNDAAKNANTVAREAVGASERGRVAVELIPDYNKAAKEAFRESLREIKEAHGSLPDTMENLMTEHLTIYEAKETKAMAKTKAKDKKKEAKATKMAAKAAAKAAKAAAKATKATAKATKSENKAKDKNIATAVTKAVAKAEAKATEEMASVVSKAVEKAVEKAMGEVAKANEKSDADDEAEANALAEKELVAVAE